MRPRVALVVSRTADGPAAIYAALLDRLLEEGWGAHLLCRREPWARERPLRDHALRRRVKFAPNTPARFSPFDRWLRQLRPHLVHFHSGWAAAKASRATRRLGCRVVITFREDGQDLGVPDPERLWSESDAFLFPSEAALERAAARGYPQEKSDVLPVPVTTGAEPRGQPPKPGVLRILSAGSLVWEQGFEHSLHAVRLLLDMGVGCEYRIVGEGDHLRAVAFARYQLGLVDDVHIIALDGADQLGRELRCADVFVDPAVTDTTSASRTIAAHAAGVPVVVTAGRRDLREDAAITVPRRNPRAIAEALARLGGDPELRARLVDAGRRVCGIPTLEEHVDRLERLYRRVLA
jgi:glycosyltransferase involved in cell wall biosynthesis